MKKYICLCFFFVSVNLLVSGCASFRKSEKKEPLYRWSNFFNNNCGPMLQFKLTSEDEAILSYPCSNDIVVSQFARRQQRHGEVELWAASDLPVEQRYQLSRSKCRASLIYLGPAHATIKFPCALVHLTVTCDIVSTETLDEMTVIQLQPTKALITFSGGIQEFRFEEDILIPLGPFKPFKSPEPSLPVTLKKDNRKCELCEQRCKVNRLKGETGVYRVTLPVVASATLHPAPPEGFTVFIAGCNFKCLHCQNWTISQYPDNNCKQSGTIAPKELTDECMRQLSSSFGKAMRADRIFFRG